jgi:hypothetical protein
MQDGRTLEESVSEVAAEAGVDPERVAADARGFVDAMCERGLLQEVE